MLSHFLLLVTLLCLAAFIHVTSSPMPGGDRGVGYAFAMIFSGGGFLLLSGFYFWSMYSKFPIIYYPSSAKPFIIFLSWVCFSASVAAMAVFRAEWHPGEFPQIFKTLADARFDIILPLMVFIPCVIYTHTTQTSGHHPWYTYGLYIPGLLLSTIISVFLLIAFYRASLQNQAAQRLENQKWEDSIKENHWKSIREYKAGDPLVFILSFTGRFHDQDIREAAVAKVKSNPNWEDDLIRLLASPDNAPHVYQFIDGNPVDHPEKFIQPVAQSLILLAQTIQERVQDSNNLQDWHFEHLSLERCIRAIDEQFSQNGGKEFVEPMKQVLQALQSPKPERFSQIRFTTEKPVADWLKKHGK